MSRSTYQFAFGGIAGVHTTRVPTAVATEGAAELCVVIAQEKLGPLAEWRQVTEPLRQPLARRLARRGGAQNPARAKVHYDEYEVTAKPEVAHLDNVAAPDRTRLIAQERRPALARRRATPLAHVALNRALGDLDTELEQLTANAVVADPLVRADEPASTAVTKPACTRDAARRAQPVTRPSRAAPVSWNVPPS